MDTSISRLADFAAGLRFEHLDASVAHDCKRRLIDALGCGVAAFDAPPSRIARKLAARVEPPDGARCWERPGARCPSWRLSPTAS